MTLFASRSRRGRAHVCRTPGDTEAVCGVRVTGRQAHDHAGRKLDPRKVLCLHCRVVALVRPILDEGAA